MIIDAIVGILLALLEAVLALIPSFTLPDLGGFGSGLGSSFATANAVFPVTTLGFCLLAIIAAKVFLNVWDLIVFVWRYLPFKAT